MCRPLNSNTSANFNLHFKTTSYLAHIIPSEKAFIEDVPLHKCNIHDIYKNDKNFHSKSASYSLSLVGYRSGSQVNTLNLKTLDNFI